MEFEIKAGAKLDLLTPKEFRDILSGWQAELARNVRYRHPGFPAAADGTGLLVVGSSAQLGPAEGFMWDVGRIMVSGLTAAQTVTAFINDTSGVMACGLFTATAPQIVYNSRSLILGGGEDLVFSGTGLTASGPYPIAMQVTEIPIQLAPRLL